MYASCLKFQHVIGFSVKTIFTVKECRSMSYLVYKKYKNIAKQNLNENTSRIISTSHGLYKRRKTAEERKSHRIIEYSPRAKGDVIGVWRDITASELAEILNKDFNYVRDIFLGEVRSPKTILNDQVLLQQALKRGGYRMKTVAKPTNVVDEEQDKDAYPRPPPKKADLKPRPPVVTVMGHVDHGKTTLLDALRHSNVVDQEFGGITQHIGAFSVMLDSGARITFLDTPGHAAFSNMRARGANITDIVVLVVAADDGVMDQTIESIRMAREARVPILVAINKIDAPNANIEKTESMLSQVGIHVERLGGDVQAVPVSALKRQNLELLTEALVLQAELLETGADPTGPVEASVVESKVHQYRGKLSTIIVQRGTLKKGDILVAGTTMGKVRTMKDESGKNMDKVPPGYPAEIDGWKDVPAAGELILEVESEKRAREVVKARQEKKALEKMEDDAKVIAVKEEQHQREYKERLDLKRKLGRFRLKREGPRKPEIQRDENAGPQINIIVKADVDGTLEAVLDTLDTYDSEQCKMDIVHYGVGAVTETDVELAETFKGIIYAFNVDCSNNIKERAETAGISIKHHNIIYKLVDDVKEEINTILPPKELEEVLGEAEVLQQFEISLGRKKIPVAGCKCISGVLKRTAMYKLIRNEEVIHEGPLSSMRHLKSETDIIKSDTECGLQLADKTINFEKGDRIVCFQKKEVPQKTDWDPGF